MKIRLYVSQWRGQAIHYLSRFTQNLNNTYESPVREQGALQEDLHNGNVDEHEYVMNYR